MLANRKYVSSDMVRNFVFGIEDSLVSTVGLISGIAAAQFSVSVILLTGTILVLVEAFSMAAGSLVSDNSADEYKAQSSVPLKSSIKGSVVMFGSYVLAGILVIIPYIIFDFTTAFWVSISLSLIALFVLGLVSAELSHTHPLKKAITMMLVGGLAILIGVLVGNLLQ